MNNMLETECWLIQRLTQKLRTQIRHCEIRQVNPAKFQVFVRLNACVYLVFCQKRGILGQRHCKVKANLVVWASVESEEILD